MNLTSAVWQISNTRLQRVNKFKYLGVLLDNTLSWKDHVEYIGNKISSRLGILRRARKVLPKPTCQMLYNTLVLPLFHYCSPVWGSCGVGSKINKRTLGCNLLVNLVFNYYMAESVSGQDETNPAFLLAN